MMNVHLYTDTWMNRKTHSSTGPVEPLEGREVTDCVQKASEVKISNYCFNCSIWGLNKATNCLSALMSSCCPTSLECLLLSHFEREQPVGGPCTSMQATEKEQKVRKQVRERDWYSGGDWMDGIAAGQDCGIRRDNGMLERRKPLCVK